MSTDPVRMLTSRLAVLKKHFGKEPGDEEKTVSARRRAYGRAYLGSSVEYLQHGDRERAYECFQKMAKVCPNLLTQLDTFYQLGCGDQPKGHMGDFASLDLQSNSLALLQMLVRLFANPDTRIRLAKCQRPAYAQAYFALGLLYYGSRKLPEARHFLWSAVITNPRFGLKRQLVLTWAKSLLSPKLLNRFKVSGKREKRFAC